MPLTLTITKDADLRSVIHGIQIWIGRGRGGTYSGKASRTRTEITSK